MENFVRILKLYSFRLLDRVSVHSFFVLLTNDIILQLPTRLMNGYGYRCCHVPMRRPLNFPWMDCRHNLLAFSRYHLNKT